MSKATVARLFLGSLAAVTAGAGLVYMVWFAFGEHVFVMSGPDVIGIQASTFAWVMVGVGIVGGLAIAGAVVGGFASWIGALLNTSQLERKTWFIVLVLLGAFSFGFFAMLAYLLLGPDGTKRSAARTA